MSYKFLLYISYRYAIPICEPLEEEILKRGDTVYWFSDNPETFTYLENRKNVFTTIKEVIDYKPDIVLTATNMVPDFISGLKVQIFHGFNAEKRPSKKNIYSHFRIRGFFDLYCTQGPSTTAIFKLQQKKYPHFEVQETGWPKVDPLFPLTDTKNEIPHVLIASTFTPRLSLALNPDIFTQIQQLSKKGNYKFTMVLHPKLDAETKKKWQSIKNQNFNYVDTVDLIPLFKKTDLLLADTTSVIQEYLLQKKPVVSFRHTSKPNYLIHFDNALQLEEKLNLAVKESSKIVPFITAYIMQLHPYFDGKSSQRVLDASIQFLHKDKRYLKPKPLNLIRKFKIRKKLGYFTLKTYRHPYTLEN